MRWGTDGSLATGYCRSVGGTCRDWNPADQCQLAHERQSVSTADGAGRPSPSHSHSSTPSLGSGVLSPSYSARAGVVPGWACPNVSGPSEARAGTGTRLAGAVAHERPPVLRYNVRRTSGMIFASKCALLRHAPRLRRAPRVTPALRHNLTTRLENVVDEI